MRTAHRLLCFALVMCGICCGAPSARAETDADLEKAKALFDDARKLMSEGKYESACPLLEQSLAIARGIGTRFNLADCEQHLEHYARAQQLYLEVAEQAREAGQADRERVARERAAAIDAKVSRIKLEIELEGDTSAAGVELDGHAVTQEVAKRPLVVAPGKHHIKVSAEGKRAFDKDVEVPSPGTLVIVSVPKLEPNKTPAAKANADADAEANSEGDETENEPRESQPKHPASTAEPNLTRGNASRSAALIVGGIGVGATVAGIAFGLQYLANNHDAKGVCPTSYGCSADEIAQHAKFIDDAHTARTWSYVGFGVGAAALTGAAVLYFTAGRPESVSATTGFNADGGWNVSLRKRF